MCKFKSVIAVVIILLFTQQSFASYAPMICDDMEKSTIVSSDKDSLLSADMAMHDHDSMSKDNKSSHEDCISCDSGDCSCIEMGSCFGSGISAYTQSIEQEYILFTDHGHRFISQNEYFDSGVYLHLFKPPIHI